MGSDRAEAALARVERAVVRVALDRARRELIDNRLIARVAGELSAKDREAAAAAAQRLIGL